MMMPYLSVLKAATVKKKYDQSYEPEQEVRVSPDKKEYGLLTRFREFVRPQKLIEKRGGDLPGFQYNKKNLEYQVDKAETEDKRVTDLNASDRNELGALILDMYAERQGFTITEDGIESRLTPTKKGVLTYMNKGLSLAGLGVLVGSVATGGTAGIAAYLGILGARQVTKLFYGRSASAGHTAAQLATPGLSYLAPGSGEIIDLVTSYDADMLAQVRKKAVDVFLERKAQKQMDQERQPAQPMRRDDEDKQYKVA